MEIVCGTRYINLIRLAVRTARLLQMRNINIDWHSYVGTYSIGVCVCHKKCRPDSDHIKMLFNYTYIVTKKKSCRSNPEIGGIYVRSNFRRYYRKPI